MGMGKDWRRAKVVENKQEQDTKQHCCILINIINFTKIVVWQ